jgi:hypothetical protein
MVEEDMVVNKKIKDLIEHVNNHLNEMAIARKNRKDIDAMSYSTLYDFINKNILNARYGDGEKVNPNLFQSASNERKNWKNNIIDSSTLKFEDMPEDKKSALLKIIYDMADDSEDNWSYLAKGADGAPLINFGQFNRNNTAMLDPKNVKFQFQGMPQPQQAAQNVPKVIEKLVIPPTELTPAEKEVERLQKEVKEIEARINSDIANKNMTNVIPATVDPQGDGAAASSNPPQAKVVPPVNQSIVQQFHDPDGNSELPLDVRETLRDPNDPSILDFHQPDGNSEAPVDLSEPVSKLIKKNRRKPKKVEIPGTNTPNPQNPDGNSGAPVEKKAEPADPVTTGGKNPPPPPSSITPFTAVYSTNHSFPLNQERQHNYEFPQSHTHTFRPSLQRTIDILNKNKK